MLENTHALGLAVRDADNSSSQPGTENPATSDVGLLGDNPNVFWLGCGVAQNAKNWICFFPRDSAESSCAASGVRVSLSQS